MEIDKKCPALMALGRMLQSEDTDLPLLRPPRTAECCNAFQVRLRFGRFSVGTGHSTATILRRPSWTFSKPQTPWRKSTAYTGPGCAMRRSATYCSSIRAFQRSSQMPSFGPDTYRFTRLLRASLMHMPASIPRKLLDVGSGSGAGGICAARWLQGTTALILADINPKALAFSAVNAALNDLPATETLFSDVLDRVEGAIDLIIANPPYLVDEERRLYRHGGGQLGIALALQIVEQGLAQLSPGGRLILYTGTPIISGVDPFFETVRPMLQLPGLQFVYEELDPDVFGEELDRQAYAHADRIAVVGLTVIKG